MTNPNCVFVRRHLLRSLLAAIVIGVMCVVAISNTASADEQADSKTMTNEQLAAKARPSLVQVRSTDRTGAESGLGAGFIIDESGLIATARHVIGEGRDILIEMQDGTINPVVEVFASSSQLDLAIVRIAPKGLPAIKLSAEDETAQGREVVAMGHPRGLRNTMASGIVSGHHEIDGLRMLQLGMSIEPGNSGGPVLDRQGYVVGIVTMKSTVAEDVGFAVPVKLLRDLQANPNPIPIARWRTIGALDDRRWQTVFGANWRQRAGKLTVNGTGTEFGGRTLCLNQTPPPAMPFDLQVIVKLADEQGAAGLVFHADGSEKHYGFYPSAGSMRLTRFNGPDVGSWTILHSEPHEAYKAGECNTLTVRIHSDRFECFVNGVKVVESRDNVLPPEQCGVAAFRGTEAEFRRFEMGADVMPKPLDPPSLEQLRKIANSLPVDHPADDQVVAQLIPFGDAAADLLLSEATILEQRAKQIRQLTRDAHESKTRQQIAAAMKLPELESSDSPAPEPDLLQAALLVAHMDNSDVDVEAYMNRIEEMAKELSTSLPENTTESERLRRLDTYLFNDLGLRGSQSEYYMRSNSYLNEVIDDREGLPITLSILYMELAKRIGLNVVGVGLPGHFVVRFEPKDSALSPEVIDPFEKGRRLSEQEITALLTGAGFPNEPRFRDAKTPAEILERLTMNLLSIAENEQDEASILRYLETLVVIAPQNIEHRSKRLAMRARSGRLTMAIADADWFLKNVPDSIDVERLRGLRQSLEEQLERQKSGKPGDATE